MSWIVVDVETDGPVPGLFSMIQLGAIVVREPLVDAPTFKATMSPISPDFEPEALAVSGITREETLGYPGPALGMNSFARWVTEHNRGRPLLASDNNGFDAMFLSWYTQKFLGRSIFGHSSMNIGSLYKGLVCDTRLNFKHMRDTPHTHDPVDDARGNAEALVKFRDRFGLAISFE